MDPRITEMKSRTELDSGFHSLSDVSSSTVSGDYQQSLQTSNIAAPNFKSFRKLFEYVRQLPILSWMASPFSSLPWEEKEEANKLLWDQDDDDDRDFEAILAAKDKDEAVVAFAVMFAKEVHQLNTKNADQQTLLHVTAEHGSFELNRLIITRGADGATTDLWGNTALHIAAKFGRAENIKALTTSLTKEEMKHPMFKVPYKSLPQDNKDQFNHDGRTPLHLATMAGSVDSINRLAEAKVDMDKRRLGDGYTALHIAVENRNHHCVEALLKKEADVESRNYKGETPMQLAFIMNDQSLVELFQKYGASPNQLKFAYVEDDSESSSTEDMDVSDCEEGVRSLSVH